MSAQGITSMFRGYEPYKAIASVPRLLNYVPDLAREIAGGLRNV